MRRFVIRVLALGILFCGFLLAVPGKHGTAAADEPSALQADREFVPL